MTQTGSNQTESIECLTLGVFATNCWIYAVDEAQAPALPEGDHSLRPCAVIDPGAEAPSIIARLRDLRLYPRFILLTHGHFDHIGALPELAAAFPGSLIAIHAADAPYLGKDAWETHRRSFSALGAGAYLKGLWKPMPGAGKLLSEGERIGPFKTLHLPGHTPGSAAFFDEKTGALFSGDTLFRGDCGRTDLPGGSQDDIEKSLLRLFTLPPDTAVLPGHGPATTTGEEAR